MRTLVTGLVAHVDAGKTTLGEAMLFASGATRRLGRVDHGDAFLDANAIERRRGITIFSKHARLSWKDTELAMVDTPGHADFGAETERALSVLDCAVLVVSGIDGVQPHTQTLWRLLRLHDVPTFVFVNKMDAETADAGRVLADLQHRLGDGFVDFSEACATGSFMLPDDEEFSDSLAMLGEEAMEEYLDAGCISLSTAQNLFANCQLFPCLFGSALKVQGVDALLDCIDALARQPEWPSDFRARVYKVSHTAKGERLTWVKVTGGELHAKELLAGGESAANSCSAAGAGDQHPGLLAHDATAARTCGNEHDGFEAALLADAPILPASEAVNGWQPGPHTYLRSQFGNPLASAHSRYREPWERKADQLRIYSGEKFETAACVQAGQICAICGLTNTLPGDILRLAGSTADGNPDAAGSASTSDAPAQQLIPILSFCVTDTGGADEHTVLQALRMLEDEDPTLSVDFDAEARLIRLKLAGAIQLEVLAEELSERFGLALQFSPGEVLYRETVTRAFECGGHFEPLRHYAEARLRIEPLPLGSGIIAGSLCSMDTLDLNWQRLVVTHLLEREHLGTLTGSPITDVRLTLLNGRAHAKHTNGGDFRQATYRGIRQGLMKAREAGCITLLEPWYRFALEVPADTIGRAMADMQKMGGTFEAPTQHGELVLLHGRVPVAEVGDYALQVNAYTHGLGRLNLQVEGYAPCHDQDRVIEKLGYEPLDDSRNPADSIFCEHGAGVAVAWDEVDARLHTEALG